jgi:O-succinylhomoserine sulfhydrylase
VAGIAVEPSPPVTDIRTVAEKVHAAGGKLAVDNTFATPVFQQPLSLGAVSSCTKA